MDWAIYLFGVVSGLGFCLLALPLIVKWFIQKKINELLGGLK